MFPRSLGGRGRFRGAAEETFHLPPKPAGCGRWEGRRRKCLIRPPFPPAATRCAGAPWAWGDEGAPRTYPAFSAPPIDAALPSCYAFSNRSTEKAHSMSTGRDFSSEHARRRKRPKTIGVLLILVSLSVLVAVVAMIALGTLVIFTPVEEPVSAAAAQAGR